MRVLIVDDDAIVIKSCRRVLEAEGMDVHTASTVEKGAAMLAGADFDLMLTDIKMPGRSGFEMIDWARRMRPGMPILMMSGYSTVETVANGRRLGADNHIAKPFTPEELLLAVRNTSR